MNIHGVGTNFRYVIPDSRNIPTKYFILVDGLYLVFIVWFFSLVNPK